MNDSEHEIPEDDENIRIVALPEAEAPGQSTAAGHGRRGPRLSRRAIRRGLRIGVVVSLLLLGALLLQSFPPLRTALQSLWSARGAASPTVTPGTDLFYISPDIPWTSYSIDHTTLTQPAPGFEPLLRLSPGTHDIEWSAPPFPPSACQISVPPRSDDTCPEGAPRQINATRQAQVLLLHDGLTNFPAANWNIATPFPLSPPQRGLVIALQQALDAADFSDIVQPGEEYMGSQGLVRADQPLRAHFRFTLDLDLTDEGPADFCQLDMQVTAEQRCLVNGENCFQLCTIHEGQLWPETADFGQQIWHVLAPVRISWDFTTLDGRVIAANQPISQHSQAAVNDHLALLALQWDGSRWQAQLRSGPQLSVPIVVEGVQIADDPACVNALDMLSNDLWQYTEIRAISSANPAQGCVIETMANINGRWGTVAFLERFGAVLAANELAHRALPVYPLANAYERGLVQRLEQLPGLQIGNS